VVTCSAPPTVTDVLVPETLGLVVLAVIVAVPAATPVMGTGTLVVPAPIDTVVGTVAADVLFEFRLISRPPGGAGAERSKLMLCTPPAPTETAWVEKVSVAVDKTVFVSPR
jgi:hypothetical protein